jgi:hypothetical protein
VGWKEAYEWLDHSPGGDARDRAARWTLDTLRGRLGDDWLGRAAELDDEGFPIALHLLGSHTHALAEALEWALRLEMCDRWDGSADFLRDLIRNPTPGRILHSRSQLTQASLAERAGWPVALEPEGVGGAPADIRIAAPSGPLVVEIRVLMPSEFGQRQRVVAESVTDWLLRLGQRHKVWIGGNLGRDPDESERRQIEEFVRREAGRAGGGQRPRFSCREISLEIGGRGADALALSSPPLAEDLFTRMVRVIAEKAEKMSLSGAGWLHVTVLTGLWTFTPWGRGPLAGKAPVMSAALNEALGERCPAGIVLTSAASLAPDDMEEELAKGTEGIGVRVGVQALRGRESLIMPFRQDAVPTAEDWLVLARSESSWLSWALARRGLPKPAGDAARPPAI